MRPAVLSATQDDTTAALVGAAAQRAGCSLCGRARDIAGAVALARRLRPDLCVLDAGLHEDVASAVERLDLASPGTAVVVAAAAGDEAPLLAALVAGARGCVALDTDPEGLQRALVAVLEGEISVPRAVVARLVAGIGDREVA